MNPDPRDKTRRAPTADTPRVDDRPLELEPDDEGDRQGYGWTWSQRVSEKLHRERSMNVSHGSNGRDEPEAVGNEETVIDPSDFSVVDRSVTGSEGGHMSDVLRWALDSMHEPSMAAADWLARDIDPEQSTATALLSNPKITLAQVKQAKSVFKTMRIVGEKSADRRIGARMYAAAIAAGLVRHHKLVSRQSNEALKRGFTGLLDDQRMPQALRDLAGMAICALNEKTFTVDAKDEVGERSPTTRPVPRSNGHTGANGKFRKR
jgi:hypothetical protein